jgi:BirA family biotin operon repressor/biotin-[acetyl-CoA-carboxylase] ligase
MGQRSSLIRMVSISKATLEWCEQQKLPFLFYPETESTQIVAKTLDLSHEQEALIMALHQSAGRGRFSRAWIDQGARHPGQFLGSFVFVSPSAPQPLFPIRVGLALYHAFSHHPELIFTDEFSIKPPNDLYLGPKKVAGLLIEVMSQGGGNHHKVIVGLGLNLFSHPKVDQSGSLKDFSDPNTPGQLWETYWKNSLTRFRQGCKTALTLQNALLNENEVLELNTALIKGLNVAHPYMSIDQLGNLKTSGGEQKSWWDL